MVSTQAIETPQDNFYTMSRLQDINTPVAFQIMTGRPEIARELTKSVQEYVDVIDLNFGCPLPHILGQKAGGYLLQFPHLMERIVRAVREETSKPITIKIRKGFDDKRITYTQIGEQAKEWGADAITLHARTVKQRYTGKADWSSFSRLKEHTSLPVIANGDIFLPGHVKTLIETKQADGVMIGRGAKKNPGIFRAMKQALQSQPQTPPRRSEVFTYFYKEYAKQEKTQLSELQDHAKWMTAGLKQASIAKQQIQEARTYEELRRITTKFFK